MSYPATGQWPEPNTLWLSAAFFPDDPQKFGDVVHMYPEERPAWCTSMPNGRSSNPGRSQTRAPPALRPAHTSRDAAVDRAGCDGEAITYMGGEHLCVVRDENFEEEPADSRLYDCPGPPTIACQPLAQYYVLALGHSCTL